MVTYKYDHLFKLLIIEESGVRKKGLFLRFVEDSFTTNNFTTIGIDFKIKIINIYQITNYGYSNPRTFSYYN